MKLTLLFLFQVAQTRIQFNEKQLLQLMHQHLLSKNLVESAAVLLKEAGLPPLPLKQASSNFPPYRTSNSSPSTVRGATRIAAVASTSSGASSSLSAVVPTTPTTPQSGLLRIHLSAK